MENRRFIIWKVICHNNGNFYHEHSHKCYYCLIKPNNSWFNVIANINKVPHIGPKLFFVAFVLFCWQFRVSNLPKYPIFEAGGHTDMRRIKESTQEEPGWTHNLLWGHGAERWASVPPWHAAEPGVVQWLSSVTRCCRPREAVLFFMASWVKAGWRFSRLDVVYSFYRNFTSTGERAEERTNDDNDIVIWGAWWLLVLWTLFIRDLNLCCAGHVAFQSSRVVGFRSFSSSCTSITFWFNNLMV